MLRPMSPPLFLLIALVVLVAGAAYCLGYEVLSSGAGRWPPSLMWSACAVLPWLVLFEAIKRREWAIGARLPAAVIALLLIGTAILTLLLEGTSDLLRGSDSAPLLLQAMRRLPAIAATLLLLLLARHAASPVHRPLQPPAPEGEGEALRRHADSIRWIRAADNYLELHLDGRIWTRRATMREAEEVLAPLGFLRIHRSAIVNRAHVAGISRNGASVRLRDGTRLPAGKAYGENLRRLELFATSPQSV